MIETGFDVRIKTYQVIENQLPQFILSESPKSVDFFKQYYISQEFQGGPVDVAENLDQYLKLDKLTPEALSQNISLGSSITSSSQTIIVKNIDSGGRDLGTKGFPNEYGLLKIGNEIITYTGITTNSFTGCVRGFSGITSYHQNNDQNELVFSSSDATSHSKDESIQNLSSLFLKEFYKKIKFSLTPGLENTDFSPELNVGNFIKEARTFYQSKGTDESFRILFEVLYGVTPKIVNLEDYLIKPSAAEFIRREVVIVDLISGDPNKIVGQTIKKENDAVLQASVSEVEIIKRKNKNYYKLSLFVGFNDKDLIDGDFTIFNKTKSIEQVSIGSSIITVDSTLGFPTSGTLISGNNTIQYSDKTINQFLGCSGITNIISPSDDVKSDEILYAYEDGNLDKKVKMRITGVLSGLTLTSNILLCSEGEKVYPKSIGRKILNPQSNKTTEQIFANSWIYNTSSRFYIESINSPIFTLQTSEIDDSSLRINDSVEILERGTQNVIFTGATVQAFGVSGGKITVILDNLIGFSPDSLKKYDIRRKLKKSSSQNVLINYGNNVVTSDVQNVYVDPTSNSFYVASNSLPSYTITSSLIKSTISNAIRDVTLQEYNQNLDLYSTISFENSVKFTTGDEIYYTFSNKPLKGLTEGKYFVKVLSPNNKIKLYSSLSFLDINNYLEFGLPQNNASGSHSFTLYSQKEEKIGSQKLLRKFLPIQNIKNGSGEETMPGSIGMLINGVEIINYKSSDKIYYGPLDKVFVLNSGKDYDVANPPSILVSNSTSGMGTTALVRPVVRGEIKEVLVDPQNFDLDKIVTVSITGGNGFGADAVPSLTKRYREVEFNAGISTIIANGGIDINNETLTFLTNHNFITGQSVVYNANGNSPLGIGTFGGSNTNQNETLVEGITYFVRIVNGSTIKLHKTLTDCNLGINTIGFTTIATQGIHKFRELNASKTLNKINVINSGSNYENRHLYVKPSGISTVSNWIYFQNHGFKSGDKVLYSTAVGVGTTLPVTISGISTINEYYVLKIDDNKFRLAKSDIYYFNPNVSIASTPTQDIFLPNHNFKTNQIVKIGKAFGSDSLYVSETQTGTSFKIPVSDGNLSQSVYIIKKSDDYVSISTTPVGIGSTGLFLQSKGSNNPKYYFDPQFNNTFSEDYKIKKYVKFNTSGSGFQIFKYPDIEVNINISYGSTIVGIITATPVVRGKIVDLYLYEKGTGYGSTTLNLVKRPSITISAGVDAQLKPYVDSNGRISSVNVQFGGSGYNGAPDLIVSGEGTGAILRPIMSNGSINSVVVINSGIGYTNSTTSVRVTQPGENAKFGCEIRSLTVNQNRFGYESLISANNQNIQYGWVGYSANIGVNYFNDDGLKHSPIIGWAYDGVPIYGPYGYSNASNNNSIKILETGYTLSPNSIEDRPNIFNNGFFVEDYVYTGSGDLDICNGRFSITPEFPNGVYAYFVGVSTSSLLPQFPYFIGNRYRSSFIGENKLLDQSFDFNSSNLIRNTFPYKVNEIYADNDFIIEPNEISDQYAVIESTTYGKVESFEISDGGDNYSVGDRLLISDGNYGGGLYAEVESVSGKEITNLSTTVDQYSDVVFIRESQNQVSAYTSSPHSLLTQDYVNISGITTFVKNLSGFHRIGVNSEKCTLTVGINTNTAFTGIVTDIFVSSIPRGISVGSSIGIGTEILSVLNIFSDDRILRVKRGLSGISSHFQGTDVVLLPNKFTIQLQTEFFDSNLNKIQYFNPLQNIGFGTVVGIATTVSFTRGYTSSVISIPTQSIYLPNHNLSTNQAVIFRKPTGIATDIGVSTSPSSNQFYIPSSGTSQTLYVINKSKDYIGLTTQIGLTTTSNGLFFRSFTTNGGITTDSQYSIETNYNQVKSSVSKIKTTVSVSTYHNLVDGDFIDLKVTPSQTVGIGTSTSVRIRYNNSFGKILVNPVGFTSLGINTSSSSITIQSHKFKTGDKVIYDANLIASGLTTSEYFIYKIDDNTINLCNYYDDSVSNPPRIVSIASTGGSTQSLSLINPQLLPTKGNNLLFDLSDSSLIGKKFKLYYDKEFINEFVSVGNSSSFNVISIGTIGIGTTASLTLDYTNDLPTKLYYSLETSGSISNSDAEVKNGSEIYYVNSVYENQYNITGVGIVGIGVTTFNVSLKEVPENTIYDQSNCEILEYNTKSRNTSGSIKKINVLSPGLNYKKLPKVIGVASTLGSGAVINPISNDIGKISKIRILDQGFEYSSDKTLRPEAYVSPYLRITDSNTVTSVEVSFGGKNYSGIPQFDLVDIVTGEKNDSGLFSAEISGSSINKINVIVPPKGLSNNDYTLFPFNNSNGVGINSVVSSSSGIVTAYLATPALGFPVGNRPFAIGDNVFVEGIVGMGETSNFNSSDNGYKFFEVIGLDYGVIPSKIEYDIRPYNYNIGLAKTNQGGIPTIVKQQDYPTFIITKSYSLFSENEQLMVKKSNVFLSQNLTVQESGENYIKVFGTYELEEGDIVKGMTSGTISKISKIDAKLAFFDTDYSSRNDYGWKDEIGKLDEDFQVIPDNDYYQNLSYSVKSPIEYDNFIDSVNRLVHPTGLKNFSDTQIINTKETISGIGTVDSISIIDLTAELSVDTISDFDFAIDTNTVSNKSKFVRFKNKRVTDYIKCVSNRVLSLDNISGEFSNKENSELDYINLKDLNTDYSNFLLQIKGTNSNKLAIVELVSVISEQDGNALTLSKGFLSNDSNTFDGEEIGEVLAFIDEYDTPTLRFIPEDPFNEDYEIKVFERTFNGLNAGVGTTSIGFINLTSSNDTIGIGSTSRILTVNSNNASSIFGSIEVISNDDINVIEFYLNYDGTDVSIAEYFINSGIGVDSTIKLCTLEPNVIGSNIVLDLENDVSSELKINGRFVGFGSTSVGIGTYRFKLEDQDDGTEKTINLVSNYKTISGITTFVGITSSNVSSLKSTIKVSYGETSSLYQILCVNDGTNINSVEYQSLSIGSTSGIGTFNISHVGSNLEMSFNPDPEYASGIGTIQSYTEFFYPEIDVFNLPKDLIYGSTVESFIPKKYEGILRRNKKSFPVFYNGTPVYMKTFNPKNSSVLNPVTGIFTIKNHFFSTGEQLIYNPATTLSNNISTSVGIGTTLNYLGISTDILPSQVYAIKVNNDGFKLATRKEYALSGICVTFTSLGSGNAHELEMVKKLEKSMISINNIVQSPIAYSLVTRTLQYNGGQIGTSSTIFSISGISSIKPKDLLKIDDEYLGIVSVGVGTSSQGPISGIGTFNLVQVERGFAGSNVAIHTDTSLAHLYRGSFNIVKNNIHFTEAPSGSGNNKIGPDNLSNPYSYFNGRVFLRQDYSTNRIYDDVSTKFNGIGQTFTLTNSGVNTSGIETGSSVLFINGIFQTPSTTNNIGQNYSFIESVGVSSVVFSGITSENGSIIKSNYDINLNQLPRGGMIVSLGSTGGLGISPLVGASVTAVVSGGTITSVGLGTTDILGSGYNGIVSIGVTESGHSGTPANITASIGIGGSLTFTIVSGGTGYSNPTISVPSPSYSNLSVIGVSRLGIGTTTDTGIGLLMDVEVGSSSTTGIGSTYFEVKSFNVTRPGYQFQIGDVFKPVGLVTDRRLASPLEDFTLTVLDVYNDKFSSWQFGELDFIDSILDLQDGFRTVFPLSYNKSLISFETDQKDGDSLFIDLSSVLVIFINGVLQVPGESYTFNGGSIIQFTQPPGINDMVDIFFYRGTRGVDTVFVDNSETIKTGDYINILHTNTDVTTIDQEKRVVVGIPTSDIIETDLYYGVGIDEQNYKPVSWSKQKTDKILNGNLVFKTRDAIESIVHPTARIIKDITSTSTEIFVDSAYLFNYEENESAINITDFDALLIESKDPIAGQVSATISGGQVNGLTIVNAGSGYTGATVNAKISAPKQIGVGVGTTATATISVSSSGSLTTPIIITNPGYGYTQVPQVIVPVNRVSSEIIKNIEIVQSFTGIVTGIGTTTGSGGHPLALKFFIKSTSNNFANLSVGYPLYISDSRVGNGVTSVNNIDSNVVGVGTTFIDNIYYIHELSFADSFGVGIITSNILSTTNVVGIASTSLITNPIAQMSVGRFTNFERSQVPVSIGVTGYTISGLGTFPLLQRRSYGLRSTGGLKKDLQ